MKLRNTATGYGSISRLLHWLIFLLVATTIPLGYLMGGISDKVVRGEYINIHKLIGVLILILMCLRVFWALYNLKPSLPFQTPKWQRISERCMHFLLYLGLIIMPVSGLVGAVAGGRPPHIGNMNIELPIGLNKSVAEFAFKNIHEPLAIILIVLISIHILAALFHHFVKRDDVLRRMLTANNRW